MNVQEFIQAAKRRFHDPEQRLKDFLERDAAQYKQDQQEKAVQEYQEQAAEAQRREQLKQVVAAAVKPRPGARGPRAPGGDIFHQGRR